ncbi:Lrp/AsnC family transcriptional regulator [Sinorhizobium meliloti]|uniref:Lrp/AsnC family transcriptional regulator n=1 Tax=Rhizobium meliloti TaxID=382 RepID=UPI0002FFAC32|nr:Lrp/AsnC family transcriptional regulator [Sinorhizobium meliloti]QND27782.1 Lrp/AsnC family transcriptional regulator [Sinorhizobium meliloti]WQO41124.1 Lrp/AsnC family transcriptional regulator [Sinorhizobium meliloti]WQO81514.1 Lrp/AsnC family transcriptional regulator [Sinorhizobium meliloti]WQP13320.1 Lrp/AsnC family transcriptional regulator [Sinorhizobium meliloti]WQP26797.1 Lrp/AsnC family transcriptional regulator [Sinorhizobium meliloti]
MCIRHFAGCIGTLFIITVILPAPLDSRPAVPLAGRRRQEIDATDRTILSILSREARIPMKSLAGRIGLSRSATAERVARLEKAGVIRGYRADIGQLEEGQIEAFLLVTLKRTPSLGVLDRLAGFSSVRRVFSVSGQLDLVVEVKVASINALNELRNEVAQLDNVEDLTTSIVLRRDIERS